jgi:triacylglycerol lipase
MLARLQRALIAALAFGAIGWLIGCVQLGRPGLGVIGALLMLAGPSLVLALEYLLLLVVRRGDPAPHASALELLRAWAGECFWSSRVFVWQQPFREHRWPDLLKPHASSGKRGIVFVHGYFCNRGFWNPWLARCHREGRPFVAVSLEPVFGELGDYVPAIDAAITRIEAATGLAPVIVAHSMGGLALRAWLAATPDAARRAHRLFTIGTPHLGTWMARWSPTINARAMRQQSPWLGTLASREAAQAAQHAPGWRACFWGHADNIVMPPSTALWPGAVAHHLRATAHVAMAFHATVLAEVSRALDDGAPAGSDAARSSSAAASTLPGRSP